MSMPLNIDYVTEFYNVMASAGLTPPERPVSDDEIHRFKVEGDKQGSQNGWYVLYGGDIPAGGFGCWKRDINKTWKASNHGIMSDKARKRNAEKIEAIKNQRDHERRRRQIDAAVKSGELWTQASQEVATNHPYLIKKGIAPIDIKQLGDALLVPMQNALGELVNIQRITFDGQKRFMYGGAIKSCYCIISELSGVAFLCEGYATGVTIHQATSSGVIVAFNAGNLESVAKSLSLSRPHLKLIMAADNDHQNADNTGLKKGQSIALGFNFPVEYPAFDSTDSGTDFNDLANSKGLAAVTMQLEKYCKDGD